MCTPTGNLILVAQRQTFPVLPLGYTRRPLLSLSAAEIRDRAARYRAMAATASTTDVRDALLGLAERLIVSPRNAKIRGDHDATAHDAERKTEQRVVIVSAPARLPVGDTTAGAGATLRTSVLTSAYFDSD